MENLSIVIREDALDKIESYLKILHPLLDDKRTQLIIINNYLDKLDTDFEYTIYQYTQKYEGFKEFCYTICLKDNILILESGIELNDTFVNYIKSNLIIEQASYKTKIKKYINKEKSKYYIIKDILIYNINSTLIKEIEIQLEDTSLINFDENNLGKIIYKFNKHEKYNYLYLWYKANICNSSYCLKFYEELEYQKLSLDSYIVDKMEEEFIKENVDNNYTNYLVTKKLYRYQSINYEKEICKSLNTYSFTNENTYFSFFIFNIFKDNRFVVDILKNVEIKYLTKTIDFLFSKIDKFYLYIYNFITSLDLQNEIENLNNDNILLYIDIIKTYMKNMSDKSVDFQKKQMLIQMLIEYTSYCICALNNRNIFCEYKFNEEEIAYLEKIDSVIYYINEDDFKKAIYLLKEAAEIYEPMTVATRYYSQRLAIENNLYTHKLSICMIVKDEEKNIDRCLKSISSLISNGMAEVIVVDTGSKDKTVDIARKYVDKVHFHPWQGNFSEARNYSISLAHGEYIFIMDADYEIQSEELDKLIQFFQDSNYKNYNTVSSRIKNFDDEKNIKFSMMTQNHIFKNDGSFHYYGTVHNQPFYKNPVKNLGMIILHYGYIMTEDIKDKKFIRTATMLKKELEKYPKHIYYRYQLSVSYSMHGEPKKALEQINIYMKLIKDQSVLYKSNLLYYNTAGIIYYTNNLYDSAIEVFDNILKEKTDFIDALYFKACSLFSKEEYRKAEKEFQRYLKILKVAYTKSDINNDTIIFYSLDSKNEAISKLLICFERLQKYDNFIDLLNEIDDKNILRKCLYVAIKGYLYLNKYDELAEFYRKKVFNNMANEDKYIFTYLIQKEFSKINNFDKNKFIEAFDNLKINDEYVNVLKLHLADKESIQDFFRFVNQIHIEEIDIITAKMVIDTALPIIKSYSIEKTYNIHELMTLKKCIKLLLNRTLVLKQFKGLDKNEMLEIVEKYIQILDTLNQKNYNNILLEQEKGFIKNIILAFSSIKVNDLLAAVKFIKEAVTCDNEMARPMELYLEKIIPDYKSSLIIEEEQMNINEFIESKNKVKAQIEKFINDGDLINAKAIIEEYEKINKNDVEIYSIKAVILIMEGKLYESESIIMEGLKVDSFNSELLYNLAYIYELKHDFVKALEIYVSAKENCKNEDIYKSITDNISRLQNKYNVYVPPKRIKLIFFVKKGLDNFIDDIINCLSVEYETKKIIVTHYNQIDEGMKWADVCWFEWCDELVSYASKNELSKNKKIICRIHGYEVYANNIKDVKWENVDRLIIVAPHIRRIFEENTKEMYKGNLEISTIFCGINLELYPVNVKKKGFNLGYLGYINYKKNLPMTFDIFKKLHDIDKRYKLFLAGQFQDVRILSYLRYFVKEYNLSESVFFDGWQDFNKKVEWFQKIDYMVISSIDEGLCFAAAEGMCSGIKPILHNCEGIKDHYDKKYIFNTIDDAVDMILSEDYNSIEYRKFIDDNYSLGKELDQIKRILSELYS